MALPADLQTGLVDWWPMAAGAGSTAVGWKGVLNLALSRSNARTGDTLSAAAGWTTENSPSTRNTYNGGGVASTAALNLLGADGDVLTVAVRQWPGAGRAMQNETVWADRYHVLGFPGDVSSSDSDGLRVYDGYLTTNGATLFAESTPGSSFLAVPADWTYEKGSLPWTPALVILTLTRVGSNVVMKCSVNGTTRTEIAVPTRSAFNLNRITFGCPDLSLGGLTQAALWTRALTEMEIAYLGDNLDALDYHAGDDATAVDEAGRSRLHFRWPVTRVQHAGVLDSEGRKRTARQGAERARREYELELHDAPPAEVALLASLHASSRGGCVPVLWRHPRDDAGAAIEGVRYRLGSTLSVQRAAGGVRAAAAVTMTDV